MRRTPIPSISGAFRAFMHHRRAARLARDRPDNLFQPFNDTQEDRYPAIFRFVREALGDGAGRRLLSFGCATGEEVFTLRRYLPAAAIKGIDIDPRNIAACMARRDAVGDANIEFATSHATAHEPAASYDAIFCMAVLRHGRLAAEQPDRCDHIIRFADFAATVADFARCLKPGGLFIQRFSNFRFADAPVSAGFDPLLRLPLGARQILYDGENRRLPPGGTEDVVFRKRA